MTRQNFIEYLQKKMPEKTPQEIKHLLVTFFNNITHALENGNKVELRGFGVFHTKIYSARTGKDPRTGQNKFFEKRYIPTFRASKHFLPKN